MNDIWPALRQELLKAGQESLVRHVDSLPQPAQQRLREQLRQVDWARLAMWYQQFRAGGTPSPLLTGLTQARTPEALLRRRGHGTETEAEWQQAVYCGTRLLEQGRVAALVVAGGQGTRLGAACPKGLLSIGPVSSRSLFQLFAEQLLARQRRARARIPYLIMTSSATHAETTRAWEAHQWFGLPPDDVWFFQQGHYPAVDARTGEVLLAAPDALAFSPDGHGGVLKALHTQGWFAHLRSRGITHIFYHQVDNPCTIVCDPAFLGWHALRQAQVSTKVVRKRSPQEKMGVAVQVGSLTGIVEYSDLSADQATATTPEGDLQFWAGSTAMHVFSLDFLEHVATRDSLPIHFAHKIVPHWTPAQGWIEPTEPQAIKFEHFIFDVLPQAERTLFMEVSREDEFNPVKNASGIDSLETAREALCACYRRWLRSAGAEIAEDTLVEISPLVALDADEVREKLPSGLKIPQNWVWAETNPGSAC